MTKKLNKRFIIPILIVFVIISYYLYTESRVMDVSYYNIEEESYTESMIGTGVIKYDSLIDIKSEVSGTIKSISASDGDFINEGEVIIVIDNTDLLLQLSELKASYDSKKQGYLLINSEYAKAVERLNQSRITEKNLSEKYAKAAILYEEGAVTKESIDDLSNDLEIQKSKSEIEEENVKLYSKNGGKYLEHITSLREIEAKINTMEQQLSKYSITIPFDATLLRSNVNEGEYIQQGATLGTIAKSGRKYAQIDVNENNIANVFKGQKSFIYPDGYEDAKIEGTVEYISPMIDEENGTIRVKVLINTDKDYLVNNLTVKSEFIIEEFNNTIVIPSNYIVKENEVYYVFKYKEESVSKDKIQIYNKNLASEYIRVVNGLEKGDIILDPSEYKKDGKFRLAKGDE